MSQTETYEVNAVKYGTLQDRHLRDNYLEVERGPEFARVELTDIRIDGLVSANTAHGIPFEGTLKLHGVSRPVAGEIDIEAVAGGYRVEARFPVRLPEFDIKKPRHLGIGVKDEIRLEIELELASARADGASS